MNKNILNIILLFGFFYMNILLGQEKRSIAVIELSGAGVSPVEVQILSDRLRTELFNTKKFVVLERDKMNEILQEQGFQLSGCTTNDCIVEAGKLIGVEQMVAGNVGKLNVLYTLNIRLIDVETGRIIKTATADCECPITDVLTKSIQKVALSLIEEGSTSSVQVKVASESVQVKVASESSSKLKYEFDPKNTDKMVMYAIELYKRGMIDESKDYFDKIIDNSEDQIQKIEGLFGILYLSQTYLIFKDLLGPYAIHDYSNIIEEIEDNITNSNWEKVIWLKFYYAKKLYNWRYANYTRDILDDILKITNNDEIIVEVLKYRIINKFDNYEKDILQLKFNYPNHPYTIELINQKK